MPVPAAAEIATPPRRRHDRRRVGARADRSCSAPAPSDDRRPPARAGDRRRPACARRIAGWLASTTCSSTSASASSSSVARNAATSSWGSLRMNPTVSVRMNGRPPSGCTRRAAGSSVTKSRSAAVSCGTGEAIQQRRLSRRSCSRRARRPGHPTRGVPDAAGVDEPARRSSCRRICITLRRITRRSDSSCVSPGPRVPMPPPRRSRWVHCPTSRGSRYVSCASSTCSLPSLVRARWAKMSRISAVRSMTLMPSASEMFRSWIGESGSSETKRSARCRARRGADLVDLARARSRGPASAPPAPA